MKLACFRRVAYRHALSRSVFLSTALSTRAVHSSSVPRFSSSAAAAFSSSASSNNDLHDLAVIGGGIVGIACARELQLRSPGRRIILVEKETALAQHQSSHNSGVIHAGIYYKPGSQRAELCQIGAEQMLDYCSSRNIPVAKVGKMIVATDQSEIAGLHVLHSRGLANGCKDLSMLTRDELKKLEPQAEGVEALLSPHTAVVNFGQVANHMAREFTEKGGTIVRGFEVVSASQSSTETLFIKSSNGFLIRAKKVLTCGGVYADRIARDIFGGSATPTIVPVRGSWLQLKPEFAHIVKRNIYPVPNPAFPFLGVHFTPTISEHDGKVNGMILGPNALLATSRLGYDITTFDVKDMIDMIQDRNVRQLFRKHWKFGLDQLKEELFPRLALQACQRYVPSLRWEHLQLHRGFFGERPILRTGVRAQAMAEGGALEEDFVIQMQKEIGDTTTADARAKTPSANQPVNIIHIRNAPSPAATSSLTIASRVADIAMPAFQWQ